MTRRVQAYGLSADVSLIVDDRFLTGGSLEGDERYRYVLPGVEIDIEGVRRLQEAVITKFGQQDADADVWLEPRLHSLLRLTRRQAREYGLWRWLAIVVMSDYVRHRWGKTKDATIKPYRYLGGGHFLRRNAISRLWWGAEMLRNGRDYSNVQYIRSSAVEQYILDQRFGNMKATALAFAKVAVDARFSGRALKFDEIKELSKRSNLLLSATALESLAPPGTEEMGEVDVEWLAEEPDADLLVKQKDTDIQGPRDGEVSLEEIKGYERWFTDVAKDVVNPPAPRP